MRLVALGKPPLQHPPECWHVHNRDTLKHPQTGYVCIRAHHIVASPARAQARNVSSLGSRLCSTTTWGVSKRPLRRKSSRRAAASSAENRSFFRTSGRCTTAVISYRMESDRSKRKYAPRQASYILAVRLVLLAIAPRRSTCVSRTTRSSGSIKGVMQHRRYSRVWEHRIPGASVFDNGIKLFSGKNIKTLAQAANEPTLSRVSARLTRSRRIAPAGLADPRGPQHSG